MISIILFALAAICNAIMDVLQFRWYDSVFNSIHLKVDWWNPEISWRNKYMDNDRMHGRKKIGNTNINYPCNLTDAWHFFKMWMIISLAGAITAEVYDPLVIVDDLWQNGALSLIILGVVWNVTFSLFFDKVLRK